jgi:hypothetical protein
VILTLWCPLVSKENSAPSIHDAFTKRNNVVQHIDRNVMAGGDIRRLLEDLSNDWQVSVEVGSDRLSNVTKGFQN